jgi:hypothetical protein
MKNHGRSEILVAMTLKITLIWDVTPCGLFNRYLTVSEEYVASTFRIHE